MKNALRLHRALLPAAVALALTACGGGGGLVRNPAPSTPPPSTPTPPSDLGFTPTVPTETAMPAVNPPSVGGNPTPQTLTGRSQHLQIVNAGESLGAGHIGSGVGIGILDSGVQRDVPQLQGRVTQNYVHVNSSVNNTAVDDVVRHGTVVASLAAGRPVTGNYKAGGSDVWGGGVAQGATVISSRIIADKRPTDDGSGQGNEIKAGQGYGDFFRAINAELANGGAKIINNSWGGLYWNDPLLTTELTNAWKDFVVVRGGLVVFANGNAGTDARYRPNPSDNASLPALSGDLALERGWITVAALNPDIPTQLTNYSQACGRAMNFCLTAPGDVVYPDYDTGQYSGTQYFWRGGGTSYAAPLVAGAAAVVWAQYPWMSNDQVRQVLLGTAKDLGDPGVDAMFGWGLLDVGKASRGPGAFLWGDFYANVTSDAVFRNAITGPGGLVKAGSATLTLTEEGQYKGATIVEGGLLSLRGLATSNLDVRSAGGVWASGNLGGNVVNNGTLFSGAGVPMSISGTFTQGSGGKLGVWLGSPIRVLGSASIGGQMTVLGVRSGYTTGSKETLLTAGGGLSGTFSRLAAAPQVFLDASLSYDPNSVFLNINRINVSKAVSGMGLGGITAMSAERVEAAMGAIDGQLAGQSQAGIAAPFIDAAGRFQTETTNAAMADVSLRSLSGQLHASSTAMTLDAMDAGRRALGERMTELARRPLAVGNWSRDLQRDGRMAQAGFDTVHLDASGQMVGHDVRVGDAILGASISQMRQMSALGALGDNSHGLQREAQLYAGWMRDGWYVRGQAAFGGFDRLLQRNLLIGNQLSRINTRLQGRYAGLMAEAGRRFDLGATAWTPYVGAQAVRVANAGFNELGGDGFGLQARDWVDGRSQAYAGLLAERGFRVGGWSMLVDARAEWQRTLGGGGAFAASFNGLQQWMPLHGIGLADHSGQFTLGLSAWRGNGATLRLDLSRRSSPLGSDNALTAQYRQRF